LSGPLWIPLGREKASAVNRASESGSGGAILVVYGFGAAGPIEIARAAQDRWDLVTLYNSSDRHSVSIAPIAAAIGRVLATPVWDVEQCVSLVGDIRVQGVVTFSDELLPIAHELASRLGCPRNDSHSITALTDKLVQRGTLNTAGVSSTRFSSVSSRSDLLAAVDAVGLPAVLKPRRGSASRGVRYLGRKSDVAAAGHALSQPSLVEEALPSGQHPVGPWLGDYVSVETVVCRDARVHFAVCDKLPIADPFRETGFIVPSALPETTRNEVEELVARALAALGVNRGVTHTEVKLCDDGPRIIEVNGRLGGSVHRLVSRISNIDPIRLALNAATQCDTLPTAIVMRGVVASRFVLAPVEAERVLALPDVHRLRQLPGVWMVDGHVNAGDKIDASAGSLSRLQTVSVLADDHDELRTGSMQSRI
jgi:biotin carboxylase